MIYKWMRFVSMKEEGIKMNSKFEKFWKCIETIAEKLCLIVTLYIVITGSAIAISVFSHGNVILAIGFICCIVNTIVKFLRFVFENRRD